MIWEQWMQAISANIGVAVFVVAAASAFFVVAAVVFLAMAASLKKRFRRLMNGSSGVNFEELLNNYGSLIDQTIDRQKEDGLRLQKVEQGLQCSLAGAGLIRYNAFQETGSDLSFSLALIDRNRDGIVLTSIFGREETRCYCKAVKKGKSLIYLSDEEKKALEKAKKNMAG